LYPSLAIAVDRDSIDDIADIAEAPE
jgi:hypothetical protein